MASDSEGEPGRSSDEAWEALGMIRSALEDVLPPGWLRPADETAHVVSAEVEAIIAAIHEMAIVIPAEDLVDRVV
ncbi:hypothetical protein ACELLULO517_27495 [Acidisoma cellulosilytica]|uniref:Uncharacterized protein n=1 Tax=Acidisoma cellulosilyticum TaxID=2802395 RepID=A0A964E6W5_9PROT|nr:hypothetical protein [Acidisoma cellulosilyticum]MCB8884011.1 hypothetical protein [Acidisoma cellulosilyticum]